jgi:hypothetical protein
VALGEAVDKVREKYGFRSLTLAGGSSARRYLDHPSPAQSFHPDSGAAREAAREPPPGASRGLAEPSAGEPTREVV